MSAEFPFLRLGEPAAQSRAAVGSKAAALSALAAAGFRVPAGFVVTKAALLDNPAAPDLARLLRTAASGTGTGPFAVRSSAAAEDLPGASFAGMYETYLQVAAADLPAAVHRCFDSASTERIRAYQLSVPGDGPAVPPDSGMAVLVQQMVVPVAAGVAFTANPLTGARDETLISAVPGLAENLVSGVATGEEWVARSGLPGLPRLTRGNGSALTEQSATAVAAAASAVALHFGCPQDIEWAVDHAGKVHILQARPMTALPDAVRWEAPGKGAWLRNFRMGEWLPEAVTPLFMYWAIPRIDAAYNEAVYASAGIKVPMGHAAVNGWYYVAPPTPRSLPHLLFGGKRGSLPYFFNSVVRPMFDPAGADRTVLGALEHEWRTDCLPAYRKLVDAPPADEATPSLDELRHTVEKVLEAAGAYLWYFAATGGAAWKMEAVLAAFWRRHLAGTAAGRAVSASERNAGYQVLLGGLAPVLPAPAPHAVYSLDWYHPTAGEQAGGQVRRDTLPASPPPTGGPADSRRQAESACRNVLKGTRHLHRFETLLGLAQHYALLREEQARDFTLGWPLLRRCLTAIGEHLRDAGVIAAPDDVYFLTLEAFEPDAGPQHAVVDRRRREWLQQRKLAAPLALGHLPRLLGNTFDRMANNARITRNLPSGALVGHPASPGRAKGRVRVVDGPEEFSQFQPGEILVAKATAPAWTPLFTHAAAVVTDGGTLAAHASLVAREYGIPAVVGVGNATEVLRTGQLVTVDGSAGTVEVECTAVELKGTAELPEPGA